MVSLWWDHAYIMHSHVCSFASNQCSLLTLTRLLVKFPRLYGHGRSTNRTPRRGSRDGFTWTTLEAGCSSQRHKCRWWRRNRDTTHFSASEVWYVFTSCLVRQYWLLFSGICLQTLGNQERFQRLRCDHMFHTRCVDTWLRRNQDDCPLCKSVHIPHRQGSSWLYTTMIPRGQGEIWLGLSSLAVSLERLSLPTWIENRNVDKFNDHYRRLK